MLTLLLLAASAHAAGIDFDRPSSQDFSWLLQDVAPPPIVLAAPVSRELVFEKSGALITPGLLTQKLANARVVYAGEQHDQASHHQVQLKLLTALHARKPGLVVGLEMVSQDLQQSLDDYLSGSMSDADFEKFWKKAWGFPFELYKPILEFCRTNHVKVVGLNAPIGVIRQIAKGGMGSLTPDQRRALPATVAQTSDAKYMAYLEQSLADHGPMTPDQKARMLEAMAAWNETMGAKVADLSAENPVLVIAGSGHMVYDRGVVESAARRTNSRQEVVLPYPLDGQPQPLADLLKTLRDPKSGDAQLADHFWLLPKD
jgi:uncharacterized iron-regulated protein